MQEVANLISVENIALIVGVLGLILGLFFYFQSRKDKVPFWTYKNSIIIGKRQYESENELKILFRENEVKQVTGTKVYVWNKGRDVIMPHDNPSSDILRIIFIPKINILKVEVIGKTREALNENIRNWFFGLLQILHNSP